MHISDDSLFIETNTLRCSDNAMVIDRTETRCIGIRHSRNVACDVGGRTVKTSVDRLSVSGATRTNGEQPSRLPLGFPWLLAGERRQSLLDMRLSTRAAWLSAIRDGWLHARPGRQAIAYKSSNRALSERWSLTFVEDDKGLVSVRGRTWIETLESALLLMGLLPSNDQW